MRNNNPPVGLPLLVGALVLTGVPSAQAAPNTFNTALPVPQGETIWREQLVLRERSDGGPMDRKVSVQALGSVLGYGITPKLAVFGVVPYFFNKALDVTTPMGRIERDTGGIGDASLFGRYTVYQDDFTGGTFRVAPIFGLTAPTGDSDDRDRFGELPRPLQVGDGAWDGFGGVVATYQTLQYQMDAQFLYRENGRHDGFAHGDETRLDASLQYRVWPLSLEASPAHRALPTPCSNPVLFTTSATRLAGLRMPIPVVLSGCWRQACNTSHDAGSSRAQYNCPSPKIPMATPFRTITLYALAFAATSRDRGQHEKNRQVVRL
ncbi:transporter [Marinobacter similis]|uniref:transporter n=1 Tax=Marinobacter similis TaxID=1420916 RepID=UPI000B1D532D|nr:transporter [Marinobacter similis]